MTDETQHPSDVISRPNPKIVEMLLEVVRLSQVEDKTSSVGYLLYLTTKEFLSSPQLGVPPHQLIPTCFAYYLEAYPLLHNEGEMTLGEYDRLNAQAILSLIDNYIETPKSLNVRGLAAYAIAASHEILSERISRREDVDKQVVFNRLTHVALLTAPVKDYMSGIRRDKNIPYIKWLRDFLAKAFAHPALDFIDGDLTIKEVTRQVMESSKVITVPPTYN